MSPEAHNPQRLHLRLWKHSHRDPPILFKGVHTSQPIVCDCRISSLNNVALPASHIQNEYVMMSSITTKQPIRMPLVLQHAQQQELNSVESKHRNQVNSTYCDIWQRLGRVCLFWAFPSLSFSLFLPFSQQRDTGWTSVGCHGYWKGNVSRDQEGEAKQAVAPPPQLSSRLQRKSSLRRHNRRRKRWVWQPEENQGLRFDPLLWARPATYEMCRQQAARIQK